MRSILLLMFITVFSFASSVWHKDNIYDDKTLSYYLPFELWLQIKWEGNKELQFHQTDTPDIKGTFKWYHPYLKKHLKVYKKRANKGEDLYTFYPKGVAKVYSQQNRAFFNNGIDVPAGFGWRTNTIYSFSQEVWSGVKHIVRIIGIEITEINFKDDFLESMRYNYYVNGTLKDTFTYKPKKE